MDRLKRQKRGKVIGSSNFFNYIFMAIGSLAGGVLYEKISPQVPFLAMILFAILGFFLTLFLVKESKKKEE
jgi:predicted MFS family arabinose efflux permease